MKKVIRMVLAFCVVFGAGYYFDEIRQTLRTLSAEDVMERAREGNVDIRKEFLEAKSRFLNGKSEILDGHYEKAWAEMEKTLHHLRKTMTMRGAETSQALLAGAMNSIARLQQSLASGRKVAADTLRDAQETLDALLDRAD